jgi:hypothetical protein
MFSTKQIEHPANTRAKPRKLAQHVLIRDPFIPRPPEIPLSSTAFSAKMNLENHL